MSDYRVGVIDVGSNTIKLLIAERDGTEGVRSARFEVEEVRIGEGLIGNPPRIDSDAMARGAKAIGRLARMARSEKVGALRMVATSAVRDAANRADFIELARREADCQLTVLDGESEARYIGMGLRTDRSLRSLDSYTLLDLGGGSLECIQFSDGTSKLVRSLNLGAVRLASEFVRDRSLPLHAEVEEAIAKRVPFAFEQANIAQGSSPSPNAVLTGGTAALIAGAHHRNLDTGLALAEIAAFHRSVSGMHQSARIEEMEIPPARSDIFPTATTILLSALDYLGCGRVYFSSRNLRFGIASELLSKLA